MFHLTLLGQIASNIGIRSVYLLVDKVDETTATSNNPEAAYALIAPLVQDLRTLSTTPFAFKFFLPDTLESFHRQFGRPDRIQQFELKWKWEDLRTILSRRLNAHSGGVVKSDYELVDVESWPEDLPATPEEIRFVLEDWIYKFAHGSPRDLIRIWQHIVAEQLRLNPEAERVSVGAIFDGLDQYCSERTAEIVPPRLLGELQRVGRLDFTTNYVANDVFKMEANSARNKMKAWTDTGVIMRQADRQVKESRRPVYHYAVEDLRVARSLMSDLDAFEFWMSKVYECDCGAIVIRDWDRDNSHVCRSCGAELVYKPVES